MRTLLFLLFLALLIFSCKERNTSSLGDPILHMSQSDETLNAIAQNVRETLPAFMRKQQAPAPGERDFMIKYPFETGEDSGFGYEHIWLGEIHFRDGRYYGKVINQPYYAGGLKQGDITPFNTDDISDWMYIRDGKIVGGLSVKYLIERIPELDRDFMLRAYLEGFE
jgi:uncharacterized protein YegJ (DUF2314 family)